MDKRHKTDNPIQPYIEEVYEEVLEDLEKQLKEIDKENSKQLDRVLKYIGELFTASFVVDGSLKPNSTEKRVLQAIFTDLITNVGLKVGTKESAVTTNLLKTITMELNNKVQFIMQAGVSDKVEYLSLTSEQIDELISRRVNNMTYDDRIWRNQADLIDKLDKELKLAIKKGKSYEKVTREMKELFASKTYEARRLARTEIGAIQSKITDKNIRDSGVASGYQWVSGLLDNTNPDDASLHGEVWEIDEEHPLPVIDTHPNCVCMIIPVIPDWKPDRNFMKEYESWKKQNKIA